MLLIWRCCHCLRLMGLLMKIFLIFRKYANQYIKCVLISSTNILGTYNHLTVLFIAPLPFSLQAEIVKRLNAICAQVIPFLSQEVRHLVAGTGYKVPFQWFLSKGTMEQFVRPCQILDVCYLLLRYSVSVAHF